MTNQPPTGTTPGMPCPECKTFIPMPIAVLLAGSGVTCPGCGLVLTLNAEQSGEALDVLKKVQDAVDALARAQKPG